MKGRIAPNAVRPELLMPPYDKMIKLIQNGVTEPEELTIQLGISAVRAGFDSVYNMNGYGEADWLSILETTAVYQQAGIQMEKYGQKLQRGETIDWSRITYYADLAQKNQGGDFTPLSEIEDSDFPFVETGFKPIDDHLGGIPEVGVIAVGGASTSGKTWLWVSLSSQFAKIHEDKKIAFFSIEMILPEIKARYDAMKLPEEAAKRIMINPHPVTVEEVIAKAATIDNLGLVGIDFADLLVRGETSTSTMEHIYRTLMVGAKTLGVPIVLLSQLSNYYGGCPTPNKFRWTRLAEALAWMVLMTYNPSTDWFGEEESKNCNLPVIKNTAYLLCWKVRGGFRKHMDDSPGAILVDFRGNMGWNPTKSGRWFMLKDIE